MNNLIKTKKPLLNSEGYLNEAGYALREIFDYDRKKIAASKWRIKEWDYYASIHDDCAFAFTVADLGYLGMLTATHLDFLTGKETKKTIMTAFPFGKYKLPSSINQGDVEVVKKNYSFQFLLQGDYRIIQVRIKNFLNSKDLQVDLKLFRHHDEHMTIATPWQENPKAFYYNQKINCQPTSGLVSIGDVEYQYDETRHFSVLDWGRGVWTYKNTWYWGSMSTLIDGKRFGFNIGYGFGDTSKASENMLFYDGKAHKLNQVEFIMDDSDYLKPWIFTSSDGRLELVMEPLLDRVDNTNLLIIKNFGHQVFGRFRGYAILDDGTRLEIKHQIGFAEKITNHY